MIIDEYYDLCETQSNYLTTKIKEGYKLIGVSTYFNSKRYDTLHFDLQKKLKKILLDNTHYRAVFLENELVYEGWDDFQYED